MKEIKRKTPVVDLPLGATEDRVVGSLNVERAIKEGIRALEPGILAACNRGILYIDEVNLLDDHVADVLLDSAAMGVNIVEREGVSVAHPSRFILVGTMNPEEGETGLSFWSEGHGGLSNGISNGCLQHSLGRSNGPQAPQTQIFHNHPCQSSALHGGFGWGLCRGMSLNGTSYLQFVIPGIIALTAMTSSFNGAGTRLNVDRLYFKSFDECLMAPIGLTSLLMGKALIGVVRGLISAAAFLIVALLIAPAMHIGPQFLLGLFLTCLTFAFLGVLVALLARSHEDMATFSSLILMPMTFLGGTFFSLGQVPM